METNAEKLARLAPKLTESEKKQINSLFQAYIFRRSKTGEVWTTCCGVHKKLDGAVTDREWAVLTAPHAPAPAHHLPRRTQKAPPRGAGPRVGLPDGAPRPGPGL